MGEFYKYLFAPQQKQWLDQRKRTSMDQLLSAFIDAKYGLLISGMSKKNAQEFVGCVTMLIHSHRHNKKEEFLLKQADKLDFSVVRDTMYKYSKKA